ncbi:histidine kinase [Gymnodinialimonas sp.]
MKADRYYLQSSLSRGQIKNVPRADFVAASRLERDDFSWFSEKLQRGECNRSSNPPASVDPLALSMCKISYDGPNHFFSAILAYKESVELPSMELESLLRAVKNGLAICHNYLDHDIAIRGAMRHQISPVAAGIAKSIEFIRDNTSISLPKDVEVEKKFLELQRQNKKIRLRINRLARTTLDHKWERESFDPKSEKTWQLDDAIIQPEREEHSILERMREARRLAQTDQSAIIRIRCEPKKLQILTRLPKRFLTEIYEELLLNATKYKYPDTNIVMYSHLDRVGRPTTYVLNQTPKVPISEIPKLTRLGFRGEEFSGSKPGTGLGLARVSDLCRELGLRFRVSTKPSNEAPFLAAKELGLEQADGIDLFFVKIGFNGEQTLVRGGK